MQSIHFRLSQILRNYIENRFQIMAPELTTEEFMRDVQNNFELSETYHHLLVAFLKESDLVKFAKVRPGASQAREGLSKVREFVTQTIPKVISKESP